MVNDAERARDALHAISPDLSREEWVRAGMGAHAAGVDFEVFDAWSAQGRSYDARAARDTWRSFNEGKGIGPGTLYMIANNCGWKPGDYKPRNRLTTAPRITTGPARHPVPSINPADVWGRCEAATNNHPYIMQKGAAGVPLAGLRVVRSDDPLRIAGESMAGSLVVPVNRADGTVSSLQCIAPPDVAMRLKAQRKPGKLNLPGCPMEGWHSVGALVPGGMVYVCEGIGQAWACWQATGQASVVCFGWGRVRTVVTELRQRDPSVRLVLVPDAGKEQDAEKIALEMGAGVARMPSGWPENSDVNDLAQRDGGDVLALILDAAGAPSKPPSRYKLLGGDELRSLPPLAWCVRGVLPSVGLAGLFGPSASGKSFLALDMAAAIAEGEKWFDCRVVPTKVVYCALEGEGGFRLRVAAWEGNNGRSLPDGLSMVLQPFKLTEPQDVMELASVVPEGAVIFLDTLNRAAPTADENSSKDMGEILSGAKQLQSLTNGLVVLVHHTGKDATKGLRGHSSLFAALDAAIEVTRNGDKREWKVAKSKDGQDGDARPFRLEIHELGTDEFNDPITSCVVRRENASGVVRQVKVPQGGNQRLVLDVLRSMFKYGETGKPGAPPLSQCIELEAAVTKASGNLTCETFRRATRTREAITGLVTRGLLGCQDGWIWLV